MRLPPWAIEAIRNGVADVARKASDAETISRVKEQAAELLRDLPENASRGIDAIVKTATDAARGAIGQGRDSMLRWTERRTDLSVRCLNASALLLAREGSGMAIRDAVLLPGIDVMRGDCLEHELGTQLHQSMTRLLDVDGHSVAIANNLNAAVAALSALANDRHLVMHRSQAIRLPSGTPLPDAFPGIKLIECGGVQTIEPSDFDGIDHACVVLADDGVHPIMPIDFGRRDVISIAVLPLGTVKPTHPSIPSATGLLDAGIDLVVMRLGVLTGGPSAAIIAGKRELVERIVKDVRWHALAAGNGITAMSMAAMTTAEPNPLEILIDTNEQNLRSRAERMAIQLTADDSIASCQITDRPALLVDGARWKFPSRQLNLRHKKLTANAWADQLRKQNPAVLPAVDQDCLVIDLRWLQACDDSLLVESICESPSNATEARDSIQEHNDDV